MSALPAYLSVPALFLTGIVVWLAVLFLWAPRRGLSFATHEAENLPEVMANRYLAMALIMAGALYNGNPGLISFVFAATGISAAHDAWIYARHRKPWGKHLFSALLSAVVAAVALILHLNAGAA